ncbi:MAG: hypothetical protein ACE5IJ_06910 [Thermoplasmata archaeon]
MITFRIGGEEGRGEVYDEKGNLILAPDEQTIMKEDQAFCEVRERGRLGFLGGRTVFLGGEGELHVTNRRLVFIREPLQRILVSPPIAGSPPTPPRPVQKAVNRKDKRIQRKRLKEFFQIGLHEVRRVRKGFLGGYRFSIEDDEQNKYRLFVRTKNGLDQIELGW